MFEYSTNAIEHLHPFLYDLWMHLLPNTCTRFKTIQSVPSILENKLIVL